MKRTIIALAVFMAIAASAGLALAAKINAPWYNETSGWSTYVIVSPDSDGATSTFTVTFFSSTGAALASTSNSLTTSTAPWVHSAAEFITTEDTSSGFGHIEFTDSGNSFDNLNILVSVEKDSTGAGFILPLYPHVPVTGVLTTTDKYGGGR